MSGTVMTGEPERPFYSVAFITSLRHWQNVKNMSRIENLLRTTLRSVSAQTVSNYKIVVVCNGIPSMAAEYPHVDFVKVDFQAPSGIAGGKIPVDLVARDKGCKYAAALLHCANKYRVQYCMFFDADDLLSNRIVEFLQQQPQAQGFYASLGYVLELGSGRLNLRNEFHRHNGSSLIFSWDLLSNYLPQYPVVKESQAEIESAFDSHFLHMLLGRHRYARDHFATRGIPFRPFPVPLAIYVLNTGENNSVNFMALKGAKKIGPAQIGEFSIPKAYCDGKAGYLPVRLWRLGRRWLRLISKVSLKSFFQQAHSNP